MANKKKCGFIIVVKAVGEDGKLNLYQRQTRSPEMLAKYEDDAKRWEERKKGDIINYEVYRVIHLKKINFRRAKKCDAKITKS